MVALTGIEPPHRGFISVQLGLSSCVFSAVQFSDQGFGAVWVAGVVPWSSPAAQLDHPSLQVNAALSAPAATVFAAGHGQANKPDIPIVWDTGCRESVRPLTC